MTHLHANFLRAIADGELLESWECDSDGYKNWIPVKFCLLDIINFPDRWKVRRKNVDQEAA